MGEVDLTDFLSPSIPYEDWVSYSITVYWHIPQTIGRKGTTQREYDQGNDCKGLINAHMQSLGCSPQLVTKNHIAV